MAALDLLCTFGGVGSKARKGFGSLQVDGRAAPPLSIETLKERSASFRRQFGWDRPFSLELLESPSLGNAIRLDPPVPTPWSDAWTVLDRIGFSYQSYMQSMRHKRDKVAMGLPRKIHGPNDDGPIRNKKTGVCYQDEAAWQPPEWLDFPDRPDKLQPKDARYSSRCTSTSAPRTGS